MLLRRPVPTGPRPGARLAAVALEFALVVPFLAADAATAQRGDQISVKVSVPFSRISWTPAVFLGNSSVETELLVMARQG
jgi:hypothetical protein